MKNILVAGIGNIFMGDDAFGVEVVRQLPLEALPEGVTVVDFGIRSYDLAYALMEKYDMVILVDAIQRGDPPGTISLIEPDLEALETTPQAAVNGHSLHPYLVLQMVQSMAGVINKNILLVGCEPETLEPDNGQLGPGPAVQAAIPSAVEMILSLIKKAYGENHGLVLTGPEITTKGGRNI